MSSIQIQRRVDVAISEEYGCVFRRILPWGRSGASDTGVGICTVPPGAVTIPHSHADHEHFYVVRGCGRIHVDDESLEIGPGDALVVGSWQVHHFVNGSATEELELVSVWSLGAFGETR